MLIFTVLISFNRQVVSVSDVLVIVKTAAQLECASGISAVNKRLSFVTVHLLENSF